MGEAGAVALRRDGAGRGHVLARPHQRRGRHPPPVPSRHRHRADHPRSDRHSAARHDQRHQAAPDGRREHGLHMGQGERQRPDPAHHAILRDARQSRHLSRRVGGGHDAGDSPVGAEHQDAAGCDHRVQVGALQRQGGPHPVQRPGRQDAGEAQADAGPLLFRGEEVQRAAARQLDARALEHAASEPDGGTNGVHIFGRTDRRAGQRRAEHPGQVLHHHRRGRDPRGRCGRHDRHRGRALRRLRPVPEQGRVRHSAGARWCSSTTCSTSSARRGKGRS